MFNIKNYSRSRLQMALLYYSLRYLAIIYRLQQPGQNPISDNSNVLWNSPSLGKITAIGYTPGFIKPPLFYLLKGKKQGQTHLFFWYSPLFGMRQKTAKNQWNCIVLNFNQIKASLFQYKFKSIFSTKST